MSATPIFGPNRGYRQWYKDEIYTGPSGTGRYVPNVNDTVVEWVGNIQNFYRVIAVNITSGLSQIEPGVVAPPSGGVDESDVLLGSGPGQISESFRLYTNTNIVPHSLSFDARLRAYGNNAHHMKVFRGTDISNTGTVISAIFSGNTVVSQNIPLEDVIISGQPVVNVRTPGVGSATVALTEGEVCTAVLYDNAGNVLSYYQLITRVTNFIRSSDASQKYIIGIELLTPLLSPTNNSLVEVPINLLVSSGHFQGKVRYSDGSSIIYPCDGVKFKLFGIDNYVASVLGQQVPLVLTYYMANNEFALNDNSPTPVRFLSEDYTLTTIAAQGMYSVKLFVAPRWQTTPTARWVLDYYMYNLDRDEIFDVTPYVEYNIGSPVFDGTLLGTRQTLSVGVNIQDVSPSFDYFRHVQTFSITLGTLGSSNVANNYFTLEYTDGNIYGQNMKAIGGDSIVYPSMYTLDISNSIATESLWLDAMFDKIECLYLPPGEIAPPTPTHFRVKMGAFSREIMTADYDNLIDNVSENPTQGKQVRLEFFKRVGLVDYELGVAVLTVKRP